MKISLQSFITLLLVNSAYQSINYPIEDGVIVLTDETFSQAINQFEYILVEFYAPWCGHCQKLAPEYSEAALILKEDDNQVPLAKIDGTKNKLSTRNVELTGYPTLSFFIRGKPIKYKGGRTALEIIDWVRRKSGSPTQLVKTQEDLLEQLDKREVVLFLNDKKNSELFSLYKKVAQEYDGVVFLHSDRKFQSKNFPPNKITILKNFEEPFKIFEGDNKATEEELKNFIDVWRYPTLMHFNNNMAIERIFGKKSKAIFLILKRNQEPEFEAFKKVAEENRELIIFSYCYWKEDLCRKLMKTTGTLRIQIPFVIVVDQSKKSAKYLMTENLITKEAISEFLKNFFSGMAKRFYKKSPIPIYRDGVVRKISGDIWEEEIIQNEDFVFVMFYAPWCGHCKKFMPKWIEFGLRTFKMEHFRVGMIDGSSNEIPGIEVSGFPTLFLFKKNKKDSGIKFEGKRTVEGLREFVKIELGDDWEDSKFLIPGGIEEAVWDI